VSHRMMRGAPWLELETVHLNPATCEPPDPAGGGSPRRSECPQRDKQVKTHYPVSHGGRINMRRLLKISDLQAFYFALTAIFICTGFVYNFFFFRLFHIKVEQFFTLQDYLASSIEKVYLIIVAILFAMMSSYLARYIIREKLKFLHHRFVIVMLYCIPAVIFITGMLMLMKYNEPSGYYLLSFAIYAGGDFIFFKIIFKGNHDSYSRYFYFTVFIFYVLLIASTVIHDRDSVLHKPMHSLKNYQVHFVRDIKINPENSIILEANDNFFFFYDKILNKAYVVPKDGISYIETTR
jgi:hypothetical protein